MRVCPKDLRPCCDDLCHGAGCMDAEGEEMVEICEVCGVPEQDCNCHDFDDDESRGTGRGTREGHSHADSGDARG